MDAAQGGTDASEDYSLHTPRSSLHHSQLLLDRSGVGASGGLHGRSLLSEGSFRSIGSAGDLLPPRLPPPPIVRQTAPGQPLYCYSEV